MSVWRGARLSCNYIGRHLDSLTLPTSDRRSQSPPPGTIAYPPALQGRHWGQGRWPAVGWPARCASRSRSAPGVRLRSDFWVVGESWGPWCWRREICCSSSNEKRIGATLSFSAARCRRSGLRVDISPCSLPAAAVHSNLAPAVTSSQWRLVFRETQKCSSETILSHTNFRRKLVFDRFCRSVEIGQGRVENKKSRARRATRANELI